MKRSEINKALRELEAMCEKYKACYIFLCFLQKAYLQSLHKMIEYL